MAGLGDHVDVVEVVGGAIKLRYPAGGEGSWGEGGRERGVREVGGRGEGGERGGGKRGG